MPHTKMRRKHDWDAARQEYIEGCFDENGKRVPNPTLEYIAIRHEIPPSSMRKHASKYKWFTARDNFRSQVAHAVNEKVVDKVSDDAAKFDEDCLSAARALLQVARGRLAKAVGINPDTGKQEVMASAHEINSIAGAIRTAQAVGRTAFGEQFGDDALNGEYMVITPKLGTA